MKSIKVTLVTDEKIEIAVDAIESRWEERYYNRRDMARFIRGVSGTIYNIKENWEELEETNMIIHDAPHL